ncbi:MAG TPA: glycoside hydrolase family 30 protein [Bacteroidales bacterium]|nr:glycoside hydrolase family 30 protein [Bacteroidales bacterium]HRW96430.1 glycoside hydrolase family 30 protein [Bacteroidales bacterium]
MKNLYKFIFLICIAALASNCSNQHKQLKVEVFETSASGHQLTRVDEFPDMENTRVIRLFPGQKHQTVIGFGSSFTESSAWLLNQLSTEKRASVLKACFGHEGSRYSLTRTHINSCDFSLGNYSYAPVAGDTLLKNFSVEEDRNDIIPMIKEAMSVSKDGFKVIASPWTSPPWMKDNNSFVGGKLLPEYYDTWALFFSKYLSAYKNEGIDIWAITVENEPLGNGNNWESMHFTPGEMAGFIKNHLGPKLRADGHQTKILAYDQNRGDELIEWAQVIYNDREAAAFTDGFAVHWYASTYDWFPESLNFTHSLSPEKHLIQTEACVDAEVPHWKDDAWYWSKEATDWGYDWAPDDKKHLHPKYTPVFRYARDIIGCLNNHVDGWIDWNMLLDRQGGPNWAKNWCVAPVIVDVETDEVYYTPLFYTLAHFSRYIRPGAVRISFENDDPALMVTAAHNPDGSIAVVLLNTCDETRDFTLALESESKKLRISARAIQTIIIPQDEKH